MPKNHAPVRLNTASHGYLSLQGQEITLLQIDISDNTNLAASEGVGLSDDTVQLDVNNLSEDASPDSANDFVPSYDASAGSHKKVQISNLGVNDHGNLSGLADDDHTQYILVDGTRAFTGTVGGVTPTANAHLTTKDYVDGLVNGLSWRNAVQDATLDTPPGSPSDGDRYVVRFAEFEITGVDTTNEQFVVAGDQTSRLDAAETIDVVDSTGNDGTYTISSVSYDAGNDETTITVSEDVTDSTADGTIRHADGAWNGQENAIATWDAGSSSWSFESPSNGWAVLDSSSDKGYTYNSTNDAWVQFAGPQNTDHGALTGLSDDDHTQYHTDARALTWLGTRSTDDLSEGASNLYFTNARADARIDNFESGFTAGSVLFADGTDITEDNGNLFWDNSNDRLGIGTASPGTRLHIVSASFDDHLILHRTAAGGGVQLTLRNGDGNEFDIGHGGTEEMYVQSPNGNRVLEIHNGAGEDALHIDSAGKNGFGTVPDAFVHFLREGVCNTRWENYRDNEFGVGFESYKSRGTEASPSAIQDGDDIFVFSGLGYDGANFKNAAYFRFDVDGAVSTDTVPGKITFQTQTDGAARDRMVIRNSGNIGINTGSPKSRLEVSGSVGAPIITVASSITLDDTHYTILADASSSAITLTLPTASSAQRRIYHIKKKDSSANAVTIDGNGSETIDGEETQEIRDQYTSITIQSDGTSWFVL